MKKTKTLPIPLLLYPTKRLHKMTPGMINFFRVTLTAFFWSFFTIACFSQTGTWTALNNSPANGNNGVMLLLTDGRVLCKNNTGTGWDILTPDASGSYVNGGWTSADDMDSSRTFCTSQVL